MTGFWVFGYGSLMWNPGFLHSAAEPALAAGYHRALCIYSHHHRGTAAKPGLVMGLNPGGFCRGAAFYVEASHADKAYRYLLRREQSEEAYIERRIPLILADKRVIEALVFVSDTGHPRFAGDLPAAAIADFIKTAAGAAGTNRAYLANTVRALRALHIHEPKLEEILRLLPEAPAQKSA